MTNKDGDQGTEYKHRDQVSQNKKRQLAYLKEKWNIKVNQHLHKSFYKSFNKSSAFTHLKVKPQSLGTHNFVQLGSQPTRTCPQFSKLYAC